MRHDTFFFSAKDAHVAHNTDAPVVAVKAFERGYYPIYTSATAERLNAPAGHSPEVLEAALIGSMCGWHVPGARDAVLAVEAAEKKMAREAA